jgi:hypothetical protein
MARLYHYLGPEDVRRKAAGSPPGLRVGSARGLLEWLARTGQRPNREGLLAVTFVVDARGDLLVADRRSEHVACAAGGPVLSAGEMFLRLTGAGPEVAEVSNQSTGYCPEPGSWPAVAAALDNLGLPHPVRFTQEAAFRRCPACGQRNVVKDGWLACGVCGADLPADWNFADEEGKGR